MYIGPWSNKGKVGRRGKNQVSRFSLQIKNETSDPETRHLNADTRNLTSDTFHPSRFADTQALCDADQVGKRPYLHFFHHPRAVDFDGFFHGSQLGSDLLVQ